MVHSAAPIHCHVSVLSCNHVPLSVPLQCDLSFFCANWASLCVFGTCVMLGLSSWLIKHVTMSKRYPVVQEEVGIEI